MEEINPSQPQQQQSKYVNALCGGLFIGAVTGIPILNLVNCACCSGIMAGGMLTIYLYRNSLKDNRTVSLAEGAMMGLIAGLIGAFTGGILNAVFGAMSRDLTELLSKHINDLDFSPLLEEFSTAAVARGFFLINILGNFVLDCIFGVIGGIIGAAVFGKAKMV